MIFNRTANRAHLAAAVAEFASRGFEGASMNAIAARTSTTRSPINHHFGNKEKLWAVDAVLCVNTSALWPARPERTVWPPQYGREACGVQC